MTGQYSTDDRNFGIRVFLTVSMVITGFIVVLHLLFTFVHGPYRPPQPAQVNPNYEFCLTHTHPATPLICASSLNMNITSEGGYKR